MSALRLLSPIKYAFPFGHSTPTKKECEKISLELRLPTLGFIFMKPPDDPLWPHARSNIPRDDQLLSGVLEIHIPPTAGGGGRRCKAIRVGMRTIAKLNMGPGRGWEEDTIFERKVEMMGGNSDGIVLAEGVQLFEFTLILPSTLAPHDWHPDGKVIQELYAELEGQPEPESPTTHVRNMFGLGRRRTSKSSASPKRGSFSVPDNQSPSPSPSSSPRPSSPALSPLVTAAGSLSITRQEEGAPLVPTYEQSQADPLGNCPLEATTDEWVTGTYDEVKSVMVMHNPNCTGSFSDLDMRQGGFAPGIGLWDLRISSDVFSIGGPIHARLALSSLHPKSTIFSWRLLVRQTHTLSSPRDDPATCKPTSSSRSFVIMERGARPVFVRHPGVDHVAVWRGVEAGGEDEGECITSATANMPKDDEGRPTTLPGLVTPIKVSHTLAYEVYFSIWGEDDKGESMQFPGPGGLRYMSIVKPLILPACALIPSLLDLPKYEQCEGDEPCAECGDTSEIAYPICLTCPSTAIAHPPHDMPSLSGTPDSQPDSASPSFLGLKKRLRLCAECSLMHHSTEYDMHGWKLCACGLDAGDIEGRMRKFATEGIRCDLGPEEREARCEKEMAERRRRARTGSA